MHLLWISSSPPSFHGSDEARSSAHLIQQLTAAGNTIDLLLFVTSEEISQLEKKIAVLQTEHALGNLFLISCARGRQSALLKPVFSLYHSFKNPKLPLGAVPFASALAQDAITALLNGRLRRLKELGVKGSFDGFHPGWDGVVYDTPLAAAHMFDGLRIVPPEGFPPIFYRPLHSLGDFYRESARGERNGLQKSAALTQAELMKEFELAFLRKVKTSFPPSTRLEARFKEILPRLQQVVLPLSFREPQKVGEDTREEHTFLLYADLNKKSVREGCEWFFREVWPEVIERRPEAKLVCLGDEVGLRRIEKHQALSFINPGDALGVQQALFKSAAFLVPLRFEEPPRSLMLQSLAAGCPIVATEYATQWLSASSDAGVFRCETESAWISSLTNIPFETLTRAGEQGRALVKEEHEPSRVAEGFLRAIEEALKPVEPALSE